MSLNILNLMKDDDLIKSKSGNFTETRWQEELSEQKSCDAKPSQCFTLNVQTVFSVQEVFYWRALNSIIIFKKILVCLLAKDKPFSRGLSFESLFV